MVANERLGFRSETKYQKVVDYASTHASSRLDILIIQSVCAGLFIGFSGHAALALGSTFFDPAKPGKALLALNLVFPVAILGIYFTGAELYTGNTMAMSVNLLHERSGRAVFDLLRVFVVNVAGNYFGCALVCYLITKPVGTFSVQHPMASDFLGIVCAKKLSYVNFWAPFLLAIGANFFVCTAIYAAVIIEETIAKMFALWFLVAVFCLGGLEHIVANFYLTSLCSAIQPHSAIFSLGHVVKTNWIPVWLGNTFAGCFLTGAIWWYNMKPQHDQQLRQMRTEEILSYGEMQRQIPRYGAV